MELDTVIALAAVIVAANAPVYLEMRNGRRILARLQGRCPLLRQDQAGDPGGGEMDG